MKILLFDQDNKNLSFCESILKLNNFNCILAGSYKDAIKYLHADSTINVIICGVPLTNEEGFEFLKYVRRNLRFRHIPIMALASNGEKENVIRCKQLGIKDILAKPIDKGILLERLQKTLDRNCGTVLLVSQDRVILDILGKTIEREKYKTLTAHSLSEAINMIKQGKIDLVITDLDIRPDNGLELLVQAKEYSPSLPVVLITGYAGLNREDAIQAGADNSIEKPFHNIQIKRILKSLISPINSK